MEVFLRTSFLESRVCRGKEESPLGVIGRVGRWFVSASAPGSGGPSPLGSPIRPPENGWLV